MASLSQCLGVSLLSVKLIRKLSPCNFLVSSKPLKFQKVSLPLPLAVRPSVASVVLCATTIGTETSASEDRSNLELLLSNLKWAPPEANSGSEISLVVAIAQHLNTGEILMQGFADREAVRETLETKRATFYSRSRKKLWTKGETSGNFIAVKDVFLDCDKDSIIYLGLPDGPTCHTGARTCYYTRIEGGDSAKNTLPAFEPAELRTTLQQLESTINERKGEVERAREEERKGTHGDAPTVKPSWTKRLLANENLLCSKIREEADELCRTLEDGEGKERAVSEMADLLYHSLVLLKLQGADFEECIEVLRKRFAQSGVEEKASRK